MSGGRSTVAFAKGKKLGDQAGDISSVAPMGNHFISKFYVECKAYSNLNFVGILNDSGHLVKFWAEAKQQAARYGKLPMMVAKQNRQPTVVCLSREGLDVLNVKLKCVMTAPQLNLYMVLLDTFLKHARRVLDEPNDLGSKI